MSRQRSLTLIVDGNGTPPLQKNEDFAKTEWGKILVENFKEEVEGFIDTLKDALLKTDDVGLDKYRIVIEDDINNFRQIIDKEYTWDELYALVSNIIFLTWPADRKIASELKDEAKAVRDRVKKRFAGERDKIFIYSSKQAKEDIFLMYDILDAVRKLTIEFSNKYEAAKREKNIIDFSDIEHLALNILIKKDENGNYAASDAARVYQGKFTEIAIDEYQDSNLVQEKILSTISKGNNIFMVGDVKQSIYKFRQARPELFLEKYNTYENVIQLFTNFRSRKQILDLTNLIFANIMSKKFGNIEYNEEEYLNLGADYHEPKKEINYAGKPELHIIDVNDVGVDLASARTQTRCANARTNRKY